jgi:hypothetical protein
MFIFVYLVKMHTHKTNSNRKFIFLNLVKIFVIAQNKEKK